MTERLRFDRFELNLAERTLAVEGEPAAVGARAFDLLAALIERRDRVVPKSELLDVVWPGLVVEENNLQVQVSTLRKLLGAKAIVTVAGRGYRFTAAPLAADAGAPAEPAPVRPRTNLPPARTRFIGRESALADGARLVEQSRLLTLTGIGGCGKTRLAQELARRQLDAFADGVWFIDLAPVQDGTRVVSVVAAALDVRETEGVPLRARLQADVASRRMLLVVDNCEHLIDAVADVVDALLGAGPGIRIVATSREAFGIDGEQIYPVRSLSLPAALDLDAMAQSEAVRIFVDRARLVDPDFAVDARNAAAIAEICRRLDGIALAIELAAARVAVLSIDDIRARLDDRFRLLTGGGRALARHQTLHATMDWSYELLNGDEQSLLRRLSVFAGGWTLAAATGVRGDDGDEYATLDRLSALHDKSLLAVEREAGTPRYRMLETVRQYAEERLGDSGEGDAVRTRHLHCMVELAEAIESLLRGATQSDAFARLAAEEENLLAAHAWCERVPEGRELGLRLAAASWRHWNASAQLERGRILAEAALARAGADADPSVRAHLRVGLATLLFYAGRYEESKANANEGLAIARQTNDRALIAAALRFATIGVSPEEVQAVALARFEEIKGIAEALGDRLMTARNLNNFAETRRQAHDVAGASRCYVEALAICRELDSPGALAIVACNYARLLIGGDEREPARAHLMESLTVAQAHANRGMDHHLLEVGAGLAALRDEPARAARLHGASLTRLNESGARREPLDEAFVGPMMARARAALGDTAFDAAEREGRSLRRDAAMAELQTWLATPGDGIPIIERSPSY